jgi:hypothetical protein
MRALTFVIFLVLSLALGACGQNDPPNVVVNNIPPADGSPTSLSMGTVICSGPNGQRNFGPTRYRSIVRGVTRRGRYYYDILDATGQLFRVFGTCAASD